MADYDYLSDNGNLSFAETANHRASQITYFDENSRDFKKAEVYFERLEQLSNSAETVFEAQLFGLRSAFYGENYPNVPRKADALIANIGSTPAEHAEAYYFKGVAYIEMPSSDTCFRK